MKSKKILSSLLVISSLSLYACPSNTVVNPSGAQDQTGTTTTTDINLDTSVKTKTDLVNAYKCAIDSTNDTNVKAQLQLGLNAINLAPDSVFSDIYIKSHLSVLKNYVNSNCNLATGTVSNSTVTTSPSPTSSTGSTTGSVSGNLSVTNGNYTIYGCDAEKTLKSGHGKSINVKFINNTGSTIRLYWLDNNGKRVAYNRNLANGASHTQQTFVTHPWIITDANDNCLGVFLFNDSTDITLNSSVFASINTGVAVGTNTGSSSSGNTGTTTGIVDLNTSIKTKADLVNAYKCAIELETNTTQKAILTNGLAQINLLSETLILGALMTSYTNAIAKYNFNGCNLATGTISGSTSVSTSTGTSSSGNTTVTAGTTSLLSSENNLARLAGVVLNVSSEYSTAWNKSRLIDGNIQTSWFTKAGDAANLGKVPYIELIFPSPVSVKGVNLKGNREYSSGYDIFEGRLIVNSSTSGTSTYNVSFPAPDRDFNVMFNQTINNVTSIKFESTKDESGDPGLAEFEVVAG